MTARIRTISYAKRSGGDTSLTLNAGVVAGDWVTLIVRRLRSQDRLDVPSWLEHLGERVGHYTGWPANTSIYAGVAPTSLTTLILTDTVAVQTDAMLVAVQDAQADAIQASAFSTGSPSPMPGFTTPGGCLLLLLEDHSSAAFFTGPYPGEEVALEAGGPFTARAQRVTSDATGDLLLGPPISGGWRAGMAFAIPALELNRPPRIDAPVTLHMSESLTGVFADPTVDVTFFSLVDLPVGSPYSIGDQLSGRTWYSGTIRDKSIQGGLTSYTLETLLATLGRVTPREALILVAGQGGVPNPLTLRECLIRFLNYYGVPFDPDVPEFYLRAGDELVVPTVPAFVIQPDQLNPASIYEQLEPFYGVFRSYTFRADEQNRLVVTPPAWIDTIGVRLHLWRRRHDGNDRYPIRQSAGAPWSTSRKPVVNWTATVDGETYSGNLLAPLELGAPLQYIDIGPITVRIQWRASDHRVQASVWPPPPPDLTVGSLYSITFVLRPETLPGDEAELLELTVPDLGPDEVVTTSADTVINQAVIPVRPRTFLPEQQIMQAAALVLASPGGIMPGLFGNTRFGPMAEDLETPSNFLELVNDTVQEGTWFWPADDTVVIQPGGNITVAYDVEEWAEQWRTASGPHAAAAQVNSYSDTVDLPANGAEVRLFNFEFPRQTTNLAPSPYGARGTVWGRWRAGENPGIELRVGNSHFVEFGYLPEMGIFGQTVYFLWGAVVKLNGTGTTFTVGDLHTYRFGFSRGADGLWEDGANMPGLSESQALFPDRVYTAPELPYEVTPEVALAMARGIVEENLTPKAVYTLTIPPTRPDGYAVGPWHMGRAARIPALGVRGRVTALDYSEAHTAQAQGDSSMVTIDVETTTAPAGSRAAATGYRRAAYGLSHYQQEE